MGGFQEAVQRQHEKASRTVSRGVDDVFDVVRFNVCFLSYCSSSAESVMRREQRRLQRQAKRSAANSTFAEVAAGGGGGVSRINRNEMHNRAALK
jgi:hypothetical protein